MERHTTPGHPEGPTPLMDTTAAGVVTSSIVCLDSQLSSSNSSSSSSRSSSSTDRFAQFRNNPKQFPGAKRSREHPSYHPALGTPPTRAGAALGPSPPASTTSPASMGGPLDQDVRYGPRPPTIRTLDGGTPPSKTTVETTIPSSTGTPRRAFRSNAARPAAHCSPPETGGRITQRAMASPPSVASGPHADTGTASDMAPHPTRGLHAPTRRVSDNDPPDRMLRHRGHYRTMATRTQPPHPPAPRPASGSLARTLPSPSEESCHAPQPHPGLSAPSTPPNRGTPPRTNPPSRTNLASLDIGSGPAGPQVERPGLPRPPPPRPRDPMPRLPSTPHNHTTRNNHSNPAVPAGIQVDRPGPPRQPPQRLRGTPPRPPPHPRNPSAPCWAHEPPARADPPSNHRSTAPGPTPTTPQHLLSPPRDTGRLRRRKQLNPHHVNPTTVRPTRRAQGQRQPPPPLPHTNGGDPTPQPPSPRRPHPPPAPTTTPPRPAARPPTPPG